MCGEHFFAAMLIVRAVCISVTVHVCAFPWQENVIKTRQGRRAQALSLPTGHAQKHS